MMQGRRNGFEIGGGGKFFYITRTYKKDAVLHIYNFSISDFKNPLRYQSILALFIYAYSYVTNF